MKRIVILFLTVVLLISFTASCTPEDDGVKNSGLGLSFSSFQKLDGWIYYVDYATGKLWRVSNNGDERMQICDDPTLYFVVHEDRVFYATGIGILSSIKTDGNDKEIVLNSANGVIGVRKLDIADGWIYGIDYNSYFYKTKKHGSDEIWLDKNIHDFCIDGEWIYYTKECSDNEMEGFQLWRMRADGEQKQQLMEEASYLIDYSENCIYYKNMDDGDIYKVPYFETEKQRVIESDGGHFLKVIGEWIYYQNTGDSPGIYKVKKDGSECTLITNDTKAIFFFVWDNWLMCLGDDSINAIRISESEETDEIIKDILSGWPNTEIYE